MIKIKAEQITYQDDDKKFTVQVSEDLTNQTRTIISLTGPGISGAVSVNDTDAFLELMYFIRQDLLS